MEIILQQIQSRDYRVLTTLLPILFFLTGCSQKEKAVQIGLLTDFKGEVSILRDGKTKTVIPGEPIFLGDTVHAFLSASAEIRCDTNESILSLKQQTKVYFPLKSEDNEQHNRIILKDGHLAATVKRQSVEHPVTFVTPDATIKVLGTILDIFATQTRSRVEVKEGRVLLHGWYPIENTNVEAGQYGIFDEEDGLETGPLPYKPK